MAEAMYLSDNNYTVNAVVNGINGKIILPFVFHDPKTSQKHDGVLVRSKDPGSQNDYNENVYDLQGWAAMESNGAAFLPAAGYRDTNYYNDNSIGDYWSASGMSPRITFTNAKGLQSNTGWSGSYPIGLSVRLVKDAVIAE